MSPNDSLPTAPSGEPTTYRYIDDVGVPAFIREALEHRSTITRSEFEQIAAWLDNAASLSTERARMERERDEAIEAAHEREMTTDPFIHPTWCVRPFGHPGEPCNPPTHWRKKPVVIDAWHIATEQDARRVAGICTGGCECPKHGPEDSWPHVHTLEGDHTWTPGDWLIRGVKGEFYFCKPDIFEATYEPA